MFRTVLMATFSECFIDFSVCSHPVSCIIDHIFVLLIRGVFWPPFTLFPNISECYVEPSLPMLLYFSLLLPFSQKPFYVVSPLTQHVCSIHHSFWSFLFSHLPSIPFSSVFSKFIVPKGVSSNFNSLVPFQQSVLDADNESQRSRPASDEMSLWFHSSTSMVLRPKVAQGTIAI